MVASALINCTWNQANVTHHLCGVLLYVLYYINNNKIEDPALFSIQSWILIPSHKFFQKE